MAKAEQRAVMKFLSNEGVKASEIFKRLKKQYGSETIGRSMTFRLCKRYKDGRAIIDYNHGDAVSTAVTPENIERVERMIRDNRQITRKRIAEELRISIGAVTKIIHENLRLRKVAGEGWKPIELSVTKKPGL